MFEVGKKYLIGEHGSDIYECIAIHERKGWLVLNGKPLTYDWTDNCKEYKEPRTITRWVNVYEDVKNTYLSFGNMWEDKDCAIRHGKGCDKTYMVYVDTIPISYTEPH